MPGGLARPHSSVAGGTPRPPRCAGGVRRPFLSGGVRRRGLLFLTWQRPRPASLSISGFSESGPGDAWGPLSEGPQHGPCGVCRHQAPSLCFLCC